MGAKSASRRNLRMNDSRVTFGDGHAYDTHDTQEICRISSLRVSRDGFRVKMRWRVCVMVVAGVVQK